MVGLWQLGPPQKSLWQVWPFLCALIGLALMCASSSARAQGSNPHAYALSVVAIDSDDAEDQADALTTALRSRVRGVPSWSLVETTASLSTLTAALKCPRIPDAPCLVRISEQLKVDRFIWGTMTKAAGNQVTVEVHLYAKGKPDTAARETYSDNLKDQNDEVLRRVAQRLLERLNGNVSGGVLTIHAGSGGGTLTVEGQAKNLDRGDASIELTAGVHTYEVAVPGFKSVKELVTIASGKDSVVTVPLVAPELPIETTSKPVPVRKIVGYGAIGVGTVLLAVAGVEGLQYLSLKSKQDDALLHDIPKRDACDIKPGEAYYAAASDACSRYQSGIRISTAAWIFAGAGAVAVGTGIVLLLTGKSSDPTADRGARIRVIPELGPTTSGLHVVGTF